MNISKREPSLFKRGLTVFAFVIMAVMVMAFSISSSSAPASADDQSTVRTLNDIQGHWASKQISQGIAFGWISGYPDGSFKPDQPVNRAEFISLVNRAAGYKDARKGSFSDVSASDWFAGEVAKGVAAGYVSGYSDNSFKPGNPITRQEAASILARVAKLDIKANTTSKISYQDASEIGGWSAPSVAAVSAKGFLAGYPDGLFKPARAMSRSEALVCLLKAFQNTTDGSAANSTANNTANNTVISKAGVYGPDTGSQVLNGSVTIECAAVILQNTTINGDLLLAAGIGDGEATLKNVTVTGNTIVKGGGSHSIVIENCTLPTLTVEKDSVRIVASGKTTVNAVQLNSGATLVEVSVSGPGFETVTLSQSIPAAAEVTLTGDFNQINVQAPANINLTSGKVSALQVADAAKQSKIAIAAAATVQTLTTNAPINVSGNGTIGIANINVPGSVFAQTPGSVQYTNGATSTIAGSLSSQSTATASTVTGTGNGGGVAPLSFTTSDPLNGATNVAGDCTIKLTFDRGVVHDDSWANNQNCITMATSSGIPVSITVSRIANNDAEKRNIYVTPNSTLSAGETYTVTISSALKANNGNTLGTTKNITFTVAGDSGGAAAPVAGILTISDGDGRSSLNAKAPNGPNDGDQDNQNVMTFKLTANATENIKIATGNHITLNVSNITGLVKADFTNLEIYTDPNGNGNPADDGVRIATGSMGDITANAALVSFNVETEQTVNASVYMNYIVQLDIANWDDNDTFTLATSSIGITATGCNSGVAATVTGGIQERAFSNPAAPASIAITQQDYTALALNEGSLNGAKIRVKATGTAFGSSVAKTDFELINAPGNLSIASLAKVSGTSGTVVDLTLSYSGDFDTDITNFAVKAKSSATSYGSSLTSGTTTLTAVVE